MPALPDVILTQEASDNQVLAQALAAEGLRAISYPCIQIKYLEFDPEDPIDGVRLSEFKLIVFTSRRGVAGFVRAKAVMHESNPAIACVGDATADAVNRLLGLACEIVPTGLMTGESLAEQIMLQFEVPVPVLHVRGSKSTGSMREILESAGWQVSELVVYINEMPELQPLAVNLPAVAMFASPSAVSAFFESNRISEAELICVAIGGTTARALKGLGMLHVRESKRPDLPALVTAISESVQEVLRRGA